MTKRDYEDRELEGTVRLMHQDKTRAIVGKSRRYNWQMSIGPVNMHCMKTIVSFSYSRTNFPQDYDIDGEKDPCRSCSAHLHSGRSSPRRALPPSLGTLHREVNGSVVSTIPDTTPDTDTRSDADA